MAPHGGGGDVQAAHFHFIARDMSTFRRRSSIDRETHRQVLLRARGVDSTEVATDRRDALLQQLSRDAAGGEGLSLPRLALDKLSAEMRMYRSAVDETVLKQQQQQQQTRPPRFLSAGRRGSPVPCVSPLRERGPPSPARDDDRLRTASATAAEFDIDADREAPWNPDGLMPTLSMLRLRDEPATLGSELAGRRGTITMSMSNIVQHVAQNGSLPFVHYDSSSRIPAAAVPAPAGDTSGVPFVSPAVPKPIPSAADPGPGGLLTVDVAPKMKRSVTFCDSESTGTRTPFEQSHRLSDSRQRAGEVPFAIAVPPQQRPARLPELQQGVPLSTWDSIAGLGVPLVPVRRVSTDSRAESSLDTGEPQLFASMSFAEVSSTASSPRRASPSGRDASADVLQLAARAAAELPGGHVLTKGVVVKHRTGRAPARPPHVHAKQSLFDVREMPSPRASPRAADAVPRVIPASPVADSSVPPSASTSPSAPPRDGPRAAPSLRRLESTATASTAASPHHRGLSSVRRRGRPDRLSSSAASPRHRQSNADSRGGSVFNPFHTQAMARKLRARTQKPQLHSDKAQRADPLDTAINGKFQKFLAEIYSDDQTSVQKHLAVKVPGRLPRSAQYHVLHPMSHVHEAVDVPGELMAWRTLKSMTADAATASLRAMHDEKSKKDTDERANDDEKLAAMHPVQLAKVLAHKWYEKPASPKNRRDSRSTRQDDLLIPRPPNTATPPLPRPVPQQPSARSSVVPYDTRTPSPPPTLREWAPSPVCARADAAEGVPPEVLAHPAAKRTVALMSKLDRIAESDSEPEEEENTDEHLQLMERALLTRQVLYSSTGEDGNEDVEHYKWTQMLRNEIGEEQENSYAQGDVTAKKKEVFQQVLHRRRVEQQVAAAQ